MIATAMVIIVILISTTALAEGDSSVQQDTSATEQNLADLNMVLIKPGCFYMGSPHYELHRENDEWLHRVCLTESFYMGKYEVSQALWRQVMGDNPSFFQKCGARCPVEQVSWHDAQLFIKRLNQQSHLVYRLPTEAEWEYAARAGSTMTFTWGYSINTEQVNYDGRYPYIDPGTGIYRKRTVIIGALPANAWGLHEMHGNVWEWVADWYDGDYFKNSPVNDPPGPVQGSQRVLRGGSWYDYAKYVRAAIRSHDQPDYRSPVLGFRLARSL